MKFFFIISICTIVLLNNSKAQLADSSSTQEKLILSNLLIMGNKKTKSWVIERELAFKTGDTLTRFELATAIQISKNNLTNTSLFNTIDIRYTTTPEGEITLFVLVDERWYLWPSIIFELAETNFNSWLENKDFTRISYGASLTQKNFRGRNENFTVHAQFGYTQLVSISYSTPYFNKKKTLGFGVEIAYGQNHEVNYSSLSNKRLFYKDVDEVQLKNTETKLYLNYRKKFYSSHIFGVAHRAVSISDTLSSLNPDFLLGANNDQQYLKLSYRYLLDQRDNKNYALEGNFISASINKFGLGLLNSEVDLWWSQIEAKKYWKLSKRTFFATMARSQFYLNGLQPYFLREGLGYTDKTTIRSYELYVIDAQQVTIGKTQFKYLVKSAQPRDMNFVPFSKFRKFFYSVYLGAFLDAGYAWDSYNHALNNLANDIQYGSGLSLDITSVYDLVFRAEYSINKFGEHRLFLHFVAPI